MPQKDQDAGLAPAISPLKASELERFTSRLIGIARANLDARLQHKIEPEDVVQSVYKSFLIRYGSEGVEQGGEGGLWSLLTLITLRKCADRVRYYRADRRDVVREAGRRSNEPEAWLEAVGREPTPELAAMFAETVEHLLRSVPEADRPILELTLQGYSTQDVSRQLGRAERSVRRLRERMRIHLERLKDSPSDLGAES
jgi:RNA polymerase sigma-70 factor (ECF subfamily)